MDKKRTKNNIKLNVGEVNGKFDIVLTACMRASLQFD